MNVDELVAIDIHTHAEEPCGHHADDGYDDFQAAMASYFGSPRKHPPTVPETAAYYRERRIGCVIFPVDAERETGFRRYPNEEVAKIAAENSDIMIPFASIDPAKGRAGAREARRLIADFGIKGFKFHPTMQGFYRTTGARTCSTRRSPRRAASRCSIPGRRRSAPACRAAWACG
jgi:predicted TIM-barrel fold metal-dependent hydrolase